MSKMEAIKAQLTYGYVPWYPKNANPESGLFKKFLSISPLNPINENNIEKLVKKAALIFEESINKNLEQSKRSEHIVPLSGGLDSRAILAALLKKVNANEITTVTFGVPGTFDFEIGNEVAKYSGTRHEIIDLSSNGWVWSVKSLKETSKNAYYPTWLFDAHINESVLRMFGEKKVVWSGYIGDVIVGSYIFSRPYDKKKNIQKFIDKNTLNNFDFNSIFIKNKLSKILYNYKGSNIEYSELLHYLLRSELYIKPTILNPRHEFKTPFIDKELIGFYLKLPRKYRIGQKLYKCFLMDTYPDMFSMPVKNNYTLPLKTSKPKILSRCM